MPYQDWYTQATNSAVGSNLPPALVPPSGGIVPQPNQLSTQPSALAPSSIQATTQPIQPTTSNTSTTPSTDTSHYQASRLRTAGRFEKESAMINPWERNARAGTDDTNLGLGVVNPTKEMHMGGVGGFWSQAEYPEWEPSDHMIESQGIYNNTNQDTLESIYSQHRT